MNEIVITVDPEGKATVEGVGFTGRTCDEKMKAFEAELGSVTKRTNNPEYNQTVKATVQQKVGS